jgi:hypothetical protein
MEFCTALLIRPLRLWYLKVLEVALWQWVAATVPPWVRRRRLGSVVRNLPAAAYRRGEGGSCRAALSTWQGLISTTSSVPFCSVSGVPWCKTTARRPWRRLDIHATTLYQTGSANSREVSGPTRLGGWIKGHTTRSTWTVRQTAPAGRQRSASPELKKDTFPHLLIHAPDRKLRQGCQELSCVIGNAIDRKTELTVRHIRLSPPRQNGS